LWTHEQVDRLGRGIRYHIVDCNDNARETPQIVGAIFARVLKEIESGALPLLPCTTFPFERASDAFRYMAQARHIGRVVFRHRHDPVRKSAAIRADATYLVTGGARGLGLLAAQWLVGEGARHLLLAGRSAPDEKASQAIESLRADGARVEFVAADVATAAGVARIMGCLGGSSAALPEVGGVIHCAAVLDDGVLAKQTPGRFAAVMAPKADGAWRLDRALRAGGQHPDFFAMYSSMSSVLGVPGQGNYVAANAFLDALAHQRRADDVPAMSVNWGAWKEVGMATRGNTVARAGAQGLLAIAPAEGMHALGMLLRDVPAQVCVNPIDWPQLLRSLGDSAAPTLLQDMVSQARGRLDSGRSATPAERVTVDYAALEPAERVRLLADMVRRELATVLAMGDAAQSILDDQTFTGLGLDSLTSVELRNRLQQALGHSISSTTAFEHPSVGAMAAHLNTLFEPAGHEVVESVNDAREESML
jgi:acyl carrier protein